LWEGGWYKASLKGFCFGLGGGATFFFLCVMAAEVGSAEGAEGTGGGIDMSVPHRLQSSWTLYFNTSVGAGAKGGKTSWDENLKTVTQISTVEDLWGTLNAIAEPTALMPSSTYYLFKTGIKPLWEDKANENGGKFTIKLRDKSLVNEIWLNSVLLVLGDSFASDDSDEICGLEMAVRSQQTRLSMWIATSDNFALRDNIK